MHGVSSKLGLYASFHSWQNLGIFVDLSDSFLHFDGFFGAHQIQLVEDDLSSEGSNRLGILLEES